MIRHVFIVARQEVDLGNYLRRAFATEDTVEIVLDRRHGERRSGGDRRTTPRPSAATERRRADRRARPPVDAQLRSLGYAMLRLG